MHRSFGSTALFAFLAMSITAAAPPKRATDMPVKTYVSDADPLDGAYTLQSDGLGAYLNAVDGVISVLMANVYNSLYNGDWEMYASGSSVRRVAVTLAPQNALTSMQAGYTVPPNPPFWGTALQAVRVIDECTKHGKSVLTMAPGATMTCPVLVRWDSGGAYRLDIGTPVEAPESTPAQITCNSADAEGCADWFIDPIPSIGADGTTSPGTAIARLVSLAKNGAVTNRGDFYMTFHFHVTRP